MRFVTSGKSILLSAIIVALLSLSLNTAWAQDKPYVMKVTTATINDAPHPACFARCPRCCSLAYVIAARTTCSTLCRRPSLLTNNRHKTSPTDGRLVVTAMPKIRG
jgi:hypothetical protein